jgi:type VI secretion system protein ImpJ
MIHARDLPAAIQWYEGMLLAPQHFQQCALRQEELLHYHASLIAPFHWGVRSIRLDLPLLGQGMLRVIELEAVMPDGLIVSHRAEEEEDLRVDLTSFAEEAKRSAIPVHLVVPADKRSGTRGEGGLARYRSVSGAPVVDENTGDLFPVAELRPEVRLLAGTPPARYMGLPLLTIRLEGESFVLGDYVPPPLMVSLASPLGRLCEKVSLRLREKATYVLETIQTASAISQTAAVEQSERVLSHLVSRLPAFEATLRSGVAAPFALYSALCEIAGDVASVGQSPIPPIFTGYEHLNPRRSFEEVANFILQSVDEGVSDAYLLVPMELLQEAFRVRFQASWMTRELVLGVLGQPGTTERQVAEWVASSRIASEGKILAMREMRILGATRAPIERREGLVPKRGMRLFSLTAEPAFIAPNEILVIENAAEQKDTPPPVQIFLYVRTKR